MGYSGLKFRLGQKPEVAQLVRAIKTKAGKFSELHADHAYFVSTSRVLDRISPRIWNTTWSAEGVYRNL